MSGRSSKTGIIRMRLPNEIIAIVQKRVDNGRHDSVSSYLRDRIIYDITRKHVKTKGT